MGVMGSVPRWIMVFYAATITTAFNLSENIVEDASPPLYQDRAIVTGPCSDNEYFVSNRCCQKCPAGTHVFKHCSVNRGLGECRNCTMGKNFTAFPNGLKACLPCQDCREGEALVEECSLVRNTLCQCKRGTYLCQANMNCSRTGTCSTCSSCPEGQEIKYQCNATANTACEAPLLHSSIQNWQQTVLIISLAASSVIILVLSSIGYFCWRRRRKGKDHQDEEQTTTISNVPNNISSIKFPQSEQHSIRSNTPLMDAEEFPESEQHSIRSNTPLMDSEEFPDFHTPLRNSEKDSHCGSKMSISKDTENYINHISGLQQSSDGHPCLNP